MRCWASSAASAAALALALAAPAAAAPVDDFARAAGALRQEIRAAQPRAKAAAQRRRDAAQACLDVFRATPAANRETLANTYGFDIALGLMSVDAPLYARFVARLERLPLRREPALAAARRILRGQVAGVEALALSLDDACTVAREWQGTNWRTPPRSVRVLRRYIHLSDAFPQETDPAERRLRRAGHPRAAAILDAGLDVGDADAEGDPVRCALVPDTCQ